MGLILSQMGMAGYTPLYPVSDSDAQAFVNANTAISSQSEADRIDRLVQYLKSAGLWTSKLKAYYPFIGATAAGHKWNLRNPSDSDAAFRIVWSGGITHDANGITGNGTSGYGDTKLNGFSQSLNDNDHLGIYVRTAGNGNMSIGNYNGGIRMYGIKPKNSGTNVFMCSYRFDTDGFLNVAHNGETGFWTLTRRAAADGEGYKNATSIGTMGDSSQDMPSENIGILCRLWSTPDQFADHNLAAVSIGTGLTATEVRDLFYATQIYQYEMGRQLSNIGPVPVVVGVGTVSDGAGSTNPGLPSGWRPYDIHVLQTESNAAEPVTAPSGWTDLAIPSGNGASQLGMFWRRAVSGDVAPTIADSGDHTIARIIGIRGCPPTGDPWNATASNQNVTGGGTTSVSFGGLTTTLDRCLVIGAISSNGSNASPYSGWTNADLTNIVEQIDNATTAGNTGSIGMFTGTKATAGSVGTSSVTASSTPTFGGYFVGALKPM